MVDLTMRQALSVWSDLESAYYGQNGYGGNTAEIYAYRLQQRDPTAELGLREKVPSTFTEAATQKQAMQAADNLIELISIFLEDTTDCEITIDGKAWRFALNGGLVHRCHVKVERCTQG